MDLIKIFPVFLIFIFCGVLLNRGKINVQMHNEFTTAQDLVFNVKLNCSISNWTGKF